MKTFADYKLDENKYIRISIWDIYHQYTLARNRGYIYDLRNYYKENFSGKLFSVHKNPNTKKPMSLVINATYGKSFFRYTKGSNITNNKESLVHEMYKEIISRLSELNLVYGKECIKIYVTKTDIEYHFEANHNNYVADVFIWFNKSEPSEYYKKWGGKLCFEVKHTHSVDSKKITDCNTAGIAIFEHKISNKLMIKNDYCSSKAEFDDRVKFITQYLKQKIYGKILFVSEKDKFKMLHCENTENQRLQRTIVNLEHTIEASKIEKNNLKQDIERLEMENESLKAQTQKLTSQMEYIKKNPLIRIILRFIKFDI